MPSENEEQREDRELLVITEETVQTFLENNYDRRLTKEEIELVKDAFHTDIGVDWEICTLMDTAVRCVIKDLQ